MNTRKLSMPLWAGLVLLSIFMAPATVQASDMCGALTCITTSNNSVALALGCGACASIGGIAIRSTFSDEVPALPTSSNSAISAIGGPNARLGVSRIQDSGVSGKLSDVTVVNNTVAFALGSGG